MVINYWAKNGLIEYTKIGIPCTVMICIEWWAYSLMMIISGNFGVSE